MPTKGDRLSPSPMQSKISQDSQDLIPLVQRQILTQLRELLGEMNPNEKIEATQVLLYQAGKLSKSSIKLLVPKNLNGKIHTVFATAEFLSFEILIEEANKILDQLQGEIEPDHMRKGREI